MEEDFEEIPDLGCSARYDDGGDLNVYLLLLCHYKSNVAHKVGLHWILFYKAIWHQCPDFVFGILGMDGLKGKERKVEDRENGVGY